MDLFQRLVEPREVEPVTGSRIELKALPPDLCLLSYKAISRELLAAWYCARDPKTPAPAKAVLLWPANTDMAASTGSTARSTAHAPT